MKRSAQTFVPAVLAAAVRICDGGERVHMGADRPMHRTERGGQGAV